MKYYCHHNMKFNYKKGFTLTEVVIVVAISSIILTSVMYFGQSIFSFNTVAGQTLGVQTGARKVLKNIVKELRSTSPSSLGAYPISLASSTAITFFSNIDSDIQKEQVRYFLQGTTLKRGVINPTGNPLVYSAGSEVVTDLIKDIRNGATPIFTYFDSNYAGTSTPLVQPVSPTSVRFVKIYLLLENDPNKAPASFEVTNQVLLRNLKDNL